MINVARFTQNVNKRLEIIFYDENICYDLETKFFELDFGFLDRKSVV